MKMDTFFLANELTTILWRSIGFGETPEDEVETIIQEVLDRWVDEGEIVLGS